MVDQKWVESISLQNFEGLRHKLNDNNTAKLLHAVIGISGEAGELIDALKKHLFYGKPLDVTNVKEELGDILFYIAMACNAIECTLEEIAHMNYQKLNKRYYQGVFSESQAIERADKK